jgi:hypothetical protein
MLNTHSLAATLDGINEALFQDRALSQAEMEEVLKWLAGRQYRSGPNAGLFAPTQNDYDAGVRLFTGEKLKTRLAARNILGGEAARALALFDLPSPEAQDVVQRLDRNLLQSCYSRSCIIGECAHSSVGLMRYLAVGKVDDAEQRLLMHIQTLSQQRNGKGRWKRFPFYYTLLAILEIDLSLARDDASPRSAAKEEMRYTAPACERFLRRSPTGDVFDQRRRAVVQKVLEHC